jgi:hypothetical protein
MTTMCNSGAGPVNGYERKRHGMQRTLSRSGPTGSSSRLFVAILCAAVTAQPAVSLAHAQQSTSASSQPVTQKISADQLDSLVAPIALYPDPMLAQVLAASTYPLEIIQLEQWLQRNPTLKDKALADAVMKQPWDPSVQALAGLPEVVKRLADDVQWTADLGNAFLAQQSDVMNAVQRMRKKALDKGTLKSSEQIKVETQVIEKKEVVVVQQANPQVVYVPSYNPVVVWGPPVYPYYPYPPIYYPPPGYYAAGVAISFGVGFAMGAFWGGGGWGWHAGWGGNDIDIDIDNNFNRNSNRNTNINRGNRNQVNANRGGAGNKWQHDPQHRGGTPYSDRATANKFGGNARGDSVSSRQANARQQASRQGGNLQSGQRSGSRPSTSGGAGRSGSTAGSRPATSNSGGGNRASGSSGPDRIGSRDMSRPGSSRNAMGSGNRSTYSGSGARSSSSRGASSMRSRGGGGRRR